MQLVAALIYMIAACMLFFGVGQAVTGIGGSIAGGYSYVPLWFANHLWAIVVLIVAAWLIQPRRKIMELVGISAVLAFPFFFFIFSGGQTASWESLPWEQARDFKKVGTVFAWLTTAFVAGFFLYAVIVRVRGRPSNRPDAPATI